MLDLDCGRKDERIDGRTLIQARLQFGGQVSVGERDDPSLPRSPNFAIILA